MYSNIQVNSFICCPHSPKYHEDFLLSKDHCFSLICKTKVDYHSAQVVCVLGE